MRNSHGRELLQLPLRLKANESAYLLVSRKVSKALRWENLPLKLSMFRV